MQTFLPFESFTMSAAVLDTKRLGKQRVEAWQIYKALTVHDYGWKNHPAVKQWTGYEYALLQYGIDICNAWIWSGYKDTMKQRFVDTLGDNTVVWPNWLGLATYHDSHKRILLEKNFMHYRIHFGFEETDRVMRLKPQYVWPSQLTT